MLHLPFGRPESLLSYNRKGVPSARPGPLPSGLAFDHPEQSQQKPGREIICAREIYSCWTRCQYAEEPRPVGSEWREDVPRYPRVRAQSCRLTVGLVRDVGGDRQIVEHLLPVELRSERLTVPPVETVCHRIGGGGHELG